MGILRLLVYVTLLLFLDSPAYAAYYWVHPSGTQTNRANCTTANSTPPEEASGHCNPTTGLASINAGVAAGDTVYFREGTHTITDTAINPCSTCNGSAGNLITYSAYTPDGNTYEAAVIYGDATLAGHGSMGIRLGIDGSYATQYVKVTHLTFQNLLGAFYIDGGDYNEISYCTFKDSRKPMSDVIYTGTATNSTPSSTVLEDTNETWSAEVTESRRIDNITDGSSHYIINSIDQDAHSITSTSYPLTGGADDTWTNGDTYNITYSSWAMTGGGGYILHDATHNWIHHNTIYNIGFYTAYQDGGVAIEVGNGTGNDSSDNNTVEYNHLYASGHHILGVNTCKYCVIRNNYLHNEGWYAETMYDAEFACVSGAQCCTETETGKCGYRVLSASGGDGYTGYSLYEGNTIAFGAYGGHQLNAGASGSGTTLGTPYNIYRYNNHYGNALYGIRFTASVGGKSYHSKLYNNTFYHNGYGADNEVDYDVARFGSTNADDNYRSHGYINANCTSCDDTNCGVNGMVIKNNIFYDSWASGNAYEHTPKVYYPSITYDYSNAYSCITVSDNHMITGYATSSSTMTEPADPWLGSPPTLPSTAEQIAAAWSSYAVTTDFGLPTGSPAREKGTYLTTVHADDTSSGTSLILTDASYFQAGSAAATTPMGSSLSTVAGDYICVGPSIGHADTDCVQITDINGNTATVADFTRADNEYVWLYKKSDGTVVLSGKAPDYGAYEYNSEESDVWTVTNTAGTGCVHLPATELEVIKTEELSIAITPAYGYDVLSVTGCGGTWSSSPYVVTPTEDCEIVSVCGAHRLTTGAGDKGTIGLGAGGTIGLGD